MGDAEELDVGGEEGELEGPAELDSCGDGGDHDDLVEGGFGGGVGWGLGDLE